MNKFKFYLSSWFGGLKKYDVTEIFTPTTPAKATFVEREYINNRLMDALNTPGKQIVIYGHSGSGKTTLLANKLKQKYDSPITIRCMSDITFDELVLGAFDKLGLFYEDSRTIMKRSEISSSLKSDYLAIKAGINALKATEQTSQYRPLLPPQLTVQRLAEFIGKANCCLVLEDFHKLEMEEKKKLAQALKIFMDMANDFHNLKIIIIGAVGSAREVVELDSEMLNRISEIEVPLMTEEETNKILEKRRRTSKHIIRC